MMIYQDYTEKVANKLNVKTICIAKHCPIFNFGLDNRTFPSSKNPTLKRRKVQNLSFENEFYFFFIIIFRKILHLASF